MPSSQGSTSSSGTMSAGHALTSQGKSCQRITDAEGNTAAEVESGNILDSQAAAAAAAGAGEETAENVGMVEAEGEGLYVGDKDMDGGLGDEGHGASRSGGFKTPRRGMEEEKDAVGEAMECRAGESLRVARGEGSIP